MRYTKEDLAFIKNGKAIQHVSSESMKGKTCVIAGATSGVGLAALEQLAEGGANLIIVARNKQKANDVSNKITTKFGTSVQVYISDFKYLDQVRKTAEKICQEHQSIDVLINSAGLHSTKRIETDDKNELVFQVNHLSSFLFTMLLLPLLKKSKQGRVIQVNSEGHRFGGLKLNDLNWKKRFYIGLRAYGASKTAQIMTVKKLAKKLNNTNVTVNAMHPGAVKSNIGSNNGWLYRTWLKIFIVPTLKPTEVSGSALYYLASSPDLNDVSGRYFNLTIDEKPMPHALDKNITELIWNKSIELTGLPDDII